MSDSDGGDMYGSDGGDSGSGYAYDTGSEGEPDDDDPMVEVEVRERGKFHARPASAFCAPRHDQRMPVRLQYL